MFRPAPLPRTLEAALRDVSSKRPEVREDAVGDLGRLGAGLGDDAARGRVLRALEGALRDESSRVRSAAAVALADSHANESLAALLVAVEDDDPHVRQMAITALGEIGDARATERLRRALRDGRPEVRFQAVIAFPRVCASRDDAVQALLTATRDDDPLVCHIALRVAEELAQGGPEARHAPEAESGPPQFDEELVARARALVEHASPVVRLAAAILCARAGDDAGHDALVALALGRLETTESEDEATALELTGELGLSRARPGLERRAFGGLLRRDPFAWHARVALARMGDDRARRAILAELSAWSRHRRTLAVAAAGRARLQEARAILTSMRGDPARADPGAVDDALAALDGGPCVA